MSKKNPADEALESALDFHLKGKHQQATEAYLNVLKIHPNHTGALTNLGALQRANGEYQSALANFQKALKLSPTNGNTWTNLSNLYLSLAEYENAIHAGYEAIKRSPKNPISYDNLGYALLLVSRFSEAEQCLLTAIKIDPKFANAWNNLGGVYQRLNRLDDATVAYRKAIELNPSFVTAFSNLLFCMHFGSEFTREQIQKAHIEWGKKYEKPIVEALNTSIRLQVKNAKPRIGFVSADLYQHPVTDFLRPLIAHWPHDKFELFFFSNVKKEDQISDWLRVKANGWIDISKLSDIDAAQKICDNRIDILIDLTGHTGGGRLLMMAFKPAPIQMSWLGYFDTLGMQTVDYILADNIAVPPTMDHLFVERVLRLPHGFVCYTPPDLTIEINSLPATRNGYITFGSQNQLAKVTPEVIATWSAVLRRVQNSRFHFQAKAFNDENVVNEYAQKFEAAGIARNRLTFLPAGSKSEILQNYLEIDIALDTFPCAGGTTTCEALWMGVPVITLLGDRFSCRHSASHLANVGLQNTIANTTTDYIHIACALSRNQELLSILRQALRPRLISSPLCNGPLFSQNFGEILEQVLRDRHLYQ